jgi:putative endonuclease
VSKLEAETPYPSEIGSRAARVWLMRNPWAAGLTLRGDAVFVARGRLPRHEPDAYRLMID